MTTITMEQLARIMPRCPRKHLQRYLPHLNAAMDEFEINSPVRIAAFLAQLAHESGELRFWRELASGEAYEGRVDLGNTQPGDGPRYKGRGPIQLTGRTNYHAAGYALRIDLEKHPERACWPEVGFRIAGWYWRRHGCNELADRGDFTGITRVINGGLSHLECRRKYYRIALEVLGELPFIVA